MKKTHHAWARADRGNVAVITALALPVLLLAMAAGIDFTRINMARTRLTDALDAAVLAGASDAGPAWTGVASTTFSKAVVNSENATATASFVLNAKGQFEGTASSNLQTILLGPVSKLFSGGGNLSGVSVSANAAAARSGGTSQGNVCLLIKDPSSYQTLLLNSAANIKANCEVHVASTANPAAIFNAASTLDATRVCVAGTRVINNGGNVSNLKTGCKIAEDPFEKTLPTVAANTPCTMNGANYNGGNVTFNPGTYCGWYNFNSPSTIKLNPGLYIIRGGGWQVNGGSFTANGVTIYYEDSSYILFNSRIQLNMTPSTSGIYKDILFFEKPGLTPSQVIFNDSDGTVMKGIMYLPSRNVIYNSATSVNGYNLTMVFNQLLTNQTDWTLNLGPKPMTSPDAPAGGAKVWLVK